TLTINFPRNASRRVRMGMRFVKMFALQESHTDCSWFSRFTVFPIEHDFSNQRFGPNRETVRVFPLHLDQIISRAVAPTLANRDGNEHHSLRTSPHCVPVIWIESRHHLVSEEIHEERLDCSNGGHALLDKRRKESGKNFTDQLVVFHA